jgi:hypothetical protein
VRLFPWDRTLSTAASGKALVRFWRICTKHWAGAGELQFQRRAAGCLKFGDQRRGQSLIDQANHVQAHETARLITALRDNGH